MLNKSTVLLWVVVCLPLYTLIAQLDRVEPPNWWVGMQNPHLQLLVHGSEVGNTQPVIDYPGVSIDRIHLAESENYLFIDLHIAPSTRPGAMTINFMRADEVAYSHEYELRPRQRKADQLEGFSSADVIMLITPDRFANGDPDNDILPDMRETTIDRSVGFARHGGDIQGIRNQLDYIADLGYTAIWPSPLLENDMPSWSYHGYAITDYYQVDPRFGTMDDYVALADEARARGMKLIFDGVVNHCGSSHWWMEDLPFDDWLNFQDQLRETSHRRTVNQDPYAAKGDQALMTGGWFVPTMPDLNQRNPYMAEYLIQNNIWWVEVLGLGGIRQDTYPYPDKDFLSEWTCRIMTEYPNFSIVGEEWSYNPLIVAYWQEGHVNADGYTSCLRSPMDFPLQAQLVEALTDSEGEWGMGLVKLYEALANDFVYANPIDLLIFGDNHDMDRIYTSLGERADLLHQALIYLATTRGIPQFYYGTEILMSNAGFPGDHGVIRTDFPGGWAGDTVNAVTGTGLTADQQATQALLRQLLNWRKGASAIHQGRTLHFAPQNGTYVYFRYDDEQTIMVVLNKNEEDADLELGRFAEIIPEGQPATNVLTGEKLQLGKSLALPAAKALVISWEN